MKKFEFTGETKTISLFFRTATLHRIRAVAEFGLVKIGDLGGWIEKEENLSHEGKAWVWGNAKVCGDAKVWGNAEVCGDAKVCGDAEVCKGGYYMEEDNEKWFWNNYRIEGKVE